MKFVFTRLFVAAFLLLSFSVKINAQTTFNETGSVQTYTVPTGVTSILVDIWGAQGGGANCAHGDFQSRGGCGGRVQATLAVTPGHILNIVVGQKPGDPAICGFCTGTAPGGFGGGGGDTAYSDTWPGDGGGGASWVIDATSGDTLAVAGGGGGGGGDECPGSGFGNDIGGAGGSETGARGNSANCGGATGGYGGTPTAGGLPSGCFGDVNGTAGGHGYGGGYRFAGFDGSGGGGGGWYGGGSGASGSGGGGGSSYTNPLYATDTIYTRGYNGSCLNIDSSGQGRVIITVNCSAGTITGADVVCVGNTISLSDGVIGGTWGTSDPTVATIAGFGTSTVTSTGVVTAIGAGSAVISYSVSGCSATYNINVYKTPSPIIGASSVCVGSSIVLGDTATGGTWTSSAPGFATIGGISGILNGVSPGVTTVTYSTGGTGSCSVSGTYTVNPNPATIVGDSELCAGTTVTLSDPSGAGTWGSSNTAVANIGPSSGVMSGISGTATSVISFTLTSTGCSTTTTATVNELPGAIGGPVSVCVDSSITLTDTTSGGTYSSFSGNISITAAGVVTGLSAGSALITYTSDSGCSVTTTISIGALPEAITGLDSLCSGNSTLYTDTLGSGTWISTNTTIASIGSSSGLLNSLSYGLDTIIFVSPAGCAITKQVQVDSLPAPVLGQTVVCAGGTITLTDATGTGTWSSTIPGTATVDPVSGVVTGVAAGGTNIIYTSISGCTATLPISVNGLPEPISGDSMVCLLSSAVLGDAISGGSYTTTSGGTVASIGTSSGIITGISTGIDTVIYTLGTGCSIAESFTVNPNPAPINPYVGICAVEGSATLSDDSSGGHWTCTPGTLASIGLTSGVLTGSSGGLVNITYTIPSTGCFVTAVDTIHGLPATITGPATVCLGLNDTLGDDSTGGTWSSSTGVVSIGSSNGVINALSGGNTIITYTLPDGCYVTMLETVNIPPTPIFGNDSVCVNSSITVFDTTGGGTWLFTNGNATVGSSTGTITGITAGADSLIYEMTSTGCKDTMVITIDPLPAPITGALLECGGISVSLFDASTGGSWSCGSTYYAIINSSTGVITGESAGLPVVTYTLPTGCLITAVDTVLPDPSAIIGPSSVCAAGYTVTLTDDTAGGVWSSNNSAIAAVNDTTGVVTGVTSGTTYITYSVGTGCYAVDSFVVNPILIPVATITNLPDTNICAGTPVSFTVTPSNGGTMPQYQWYVNSIAAATGTGTSYNYVPGNGDVVSVRLVSNAICAVPDTVDGAKTMNILPIVTPGVTVSTPAGMGDTICVGVAVTFTATPQNGGPNPAYQWTVNWLPAGTDSANYTYTPMNGDVIRCKMISDSLCAQPDTANGQVIITVSGMDTPLVHIIPSFGDTVCEGTTVTFTVVPKYGGYHPQYQWTINGNNAGNGSSITYIPGDHDTVKCSMISDYPCLATDTASNYIVMQVDSVTQPVVSVTQQGGVIVLPGGRDTFTATILSGGGNNPAYQWFTNSVLVPGATNSVFIDSLLGATNQVDSIDCQVINTGYCNGVVGFNYVIVRVGWNVGTPLIGTGNDQLNIIPNPNRGNFTIKGSLEVNNDEAINIIITDMIGQEVYRDVIHASNGMVNAAIHLGADLSNGVYLLNVSSDHLHHVSQIILDK